MDNQNGMSAVPTQTDSTTNTTVTTPTAQAPVAPNAGRQTGEQMGVMPASGFGPEQPKPKKGLWKYVLIILGGVLAMVAAVWLVIALFAQRNVSRTVMIYMVGSNLESQNGLASDELAGISNPEQVAENGINVVLLAGGSKRWKNEAIEADETSIYELGKDGFVKIKEQEMQNMGKAEVLENFLNYVTDNYKTDEYDLVFWNHGGAIQGAEYDELHDNDYLSIAEMQEALEGSEFGGRHKLEAVIFSTCLNGSIEMADMFKDYARYLVASEEVSMSYTGASDFMFLEEVLPSDEGYELGQKFVEKYQSKAADLKKLNAARGASTSIYSTYSVVDLAKIDAVEAALEKFFAGIDVMDSYKKIAQVRANLYQYAQSGGSDDYDMVDLYNLVSGLDEFSTVPAETVQRAIEDAVVYNYATDMKSRGISVYFPYAGSKTAKEFFMKYYDEIAPAKSYGEFVADFYAVQKGGSSRVMSLNDNQTAATATGDNVMEFRLELSDEQAEDFASASYAVVRSNPEFPGYYWPTLTGGTARLEGKTLVADVRNHQLAIEDDDGVERTIMVHESEAADGKVQYEFAVTLEKLKDDLVIDAAKITITGDQETGEVKVENVRLIDDDGPTSGRYVSLDDYDNVAFAVSSFNFINEDMSYNEDATSNGVIQGWEVGTDELDLRFQDGFEEGYEYYCMFVVRDIYNNVTYSKFVKLNN